ncbi:hypothetical protein ACFLQL_03565 [Verrucomicrobiota bacterium]
MTITKKKNNIMDPIKGNLIWKSPRPYNATNIPDPDKIRLEFPHLIRFKGAWYCGFREAQIHDNHPSGNARIIRSSDGEKWETVKLIQWEGADAGTPRFSVTAEGQLMMTSTVLFVSNEPRSDGQYYQLDRKTLGMGLVPHSEMEADVACQAVTWLTSDGENWGTAYACPNALNTNRFNVTWFNGMGYSVTNAFGINQTGTLHRTRDGKSWRILLKDFIPAEQGDEAGLAFTPEGLACCLLRGNRSTIAMIGLSKPPYYQEWQWIHPKVDWREDGNVRPANDVFRVELGGPTIITLKGGRLLGAGRTLPPERPEGPWRVDASDPQGKEDGRIVLFWIDPEKGCFTRFAEIDGTSYPGVVEHEGMIWVTYVVYWGDQPGIYLAKVKVPD